MMGFCRTMRIITKKVEMFHVFQMGLERLEESKNAWAEVKRFVEAKLAKFSS